MPIEPFPVIILFAITGEDDSLEIPNNVFPVIMLLLIKDNDEEELTIPCQLFSVIVLSVIIEDEFVYHSINLFFDLLWHLAKN